MCWAKGDASFSKEERPPRPSMLFFLLRARSRVRDTLRASSPGATGQQTCRCGHPRVAHEHYRAGLDCALCDCLTFRRQR